MPRLVLSEGMPPSLVDLAHCKPSESVTVRRTTLEPEVLNLTVAWELLVPPVTIVSAGKLHCQAVLTAPPEATVVSVNETCSSLAGLEGNQLNLIAGAAWAMVLKLGPFAVLHKGLYW